MQLLTVDFSRMLDLTGGMFVMTVDQVDSRTHPDAVPALLQVLRDLPVVLPFERTAGDEVQGVLSDPRAVVDAWEAIVRDGRWTVGIGVGRDVELSDSSRASRGGAFHAAREAVEEAKGHPDRVAVRMSGACAQDVGSGSGESPGCGRARADVHAAVDDAQAVLRLLAIVVAGRTDAGWRVIDAAREAPEATQAELADRLGITRQAVSKALRTHDAVTVDDGLRTAARLLARTLALCAAPAGSAGERERAEGDR